MQQKVAETFLGVIAYGLGVQGRDGLFFLLTTAGRLFYDPRDFYLSHMAHFSTAFEQYSTCLWEVVVMTLETVTLRKYNMDFSQKRN